MFWKVLVAAVVAIAAAFLTQSVGITVATFLIALIVVLIVEGIRVVPQQQAWVIERLGKFHEVLPPGLNVIVPFIDRVAYRHSLKEVPLDIPEQVCITKDNTQLAVDGIIYYQVADPKLASYGSSDYVLAISQLAQTALRSEVGKMELDKTFESRSEINHMVVSVLDEAGRTWGIKVLRYEIKSLTPPEAILRSMQAQITAEREKRALIAKSEGQRQQEINIADGAKQAKVLESEGDKTAAINKAQGEALALTTVAEATANAVRQVAAAIGSRGRDAGREPEGRREVRRGLRRPREDRQHADRAREPHRRVDVRLDRDDGARQDEGVLGRAEIADGRPRVRLRDAGAARGPDPGPRRRARARRPSTRRRPSSSTAPTTRRASSTCRPSATSTRGCRTRPPPMFEQRMAALEGGRAAVATASGQAAEMVALLNICQAGDHIVSSSKLYGGTHTMLAVNFPKLGIEATLVDPDDPENFRRAIRPNTKAVFSETLGNPAINMIDIAAVGRRSRARRACRSSSTTPPPRPTSASP